MARNDGQRNVREAILRLVAERGSAQSGGIAQSLGLTRQALHRHLRRLVDAGDLVAEGAGRGASYRCPSRFRLPLAGLAEDRVWSDIGSAALRRVAPSRSAAAESAFHYAFTVLLDNAIDHSGGRWVDVTFEKAGDRVAFEIADDGVGIFARVRRGLRLPSELAALQELSKGKVTTQPKRHTGEGIFFCSKVADLFEVESGALRWIVDNVAADTAVGEVAPPRKGTRVRFELSPRSRRKLETIFAEYTEDLEFAKTRTYVKLFAIGTTFVSRSEARRLLHGLDRFREVILDFGGVELVGQGFADEVFRVWAGAHPAVRLVHVRASKPVAFMLERSRRAGAGSPQAPARRRPKRR